jgi:hypothetical protein
MRWRVEITEQNGDDRLLRDVLEAYSIRLHEQAGKLFLVAPVAKPGSGRK